MTCIRKIETTDRVLYLTFDDGPDANGTPRTMEILKTANAKATFFVIGEKVKQYPTIVRELVAQGHTIGNHSSDHRYRNFFHGRKHIARWIESAQHELEDFLGEAPVGFRSPAGIQTPPLHRALADLQIPLIHWNVRFFDRGHAFTRNRADKSLANLKPGNIILLHDFQRSAFQIQFEETLGYYLKSAQAQGFEFRALTSEVL